MKIVRNIVYAICAVVGTVVLAALLYDFVNLPAMYADPIFFVVLGTAAYLIKRRRNRT